MSTEENKEIEVFGTVEVSVKEFMGLNKKNLVVLENYDKAKENLLELKSKHEARITELIAKERLSKEELKELISIRGELRSPRYLIQNFKKDNTSVFATYSKNDKSKWDDLIEINEPLEDTADVKIKAEEAIVQSEKDAEAKAEELRIEKIKSKIETFESDCYVIIQLSTIDNVEENKGKLDLLVNEEFDYEEYYILFEQARARVQSSWDLKCNDIQQREEQRLENEAMKQEIFQVRVNRLKEVGADYIDEDKKKALIGYDLKGVSVLAEEKYLFFYGEIVSEKDVIESDSNKFEEILLKVKSSKEKYEKDEQFEVRKNRLTEIGFGINEIDVFMFDIPEYGISNSKETIYNASISEFEEILSDAKKSIHEAKERKELADKKASDEKRKLMFKELGYSLDAGFISIIINRGDKTKYTLTEEQVFGSSDAEFEKCFLEFTKEYDSFKLSIEKEAKKKADAENKARVKRLAKDKESIQNALTLIKETVIGEIVFRKYDNEETESFRAKLEVDFDKFIDDCSTQLNEL